MSELDSTPSAIATYQRRASVAANLAVVLAVVALAIAVMWFFSHRSLRLAMREADDRAKEELRESDARAEAELSALQHEAERTVLELNSQITLAKKQLRTLEASAEKSRKDYEKRVNELLSALRKTAAEKQALERQVAALKISRLLDPRPLPEANRTAAAHSTGSP